jgi:hypothetical protein
MAIMSSTPNSDQKVGENRVALLRGGRDDSSDPRWQSLADKRKADAQLAQRPQGKRNESVTDAPSGYCPQNEGIS